MIFTNALLFEPTNCTDRDELNFGSMDSIRSTFPNLSEETWQKLEFWAALVREWNSKVNLISRKDIKHLEQRHLGHCLAITHYLKLAKGAQILDVGTGGGFPGIIMAICYPQAHFTLIDSIGKKIAAVQGMADRLMLENVEAKQVRAESIDKKFDFITGRAVKNLPEFFSWIKGNLSQGSRHSLPNGVIYWKGGEFEKELLHLRINPSAVIRLETKLGDPYFEQKYILHFEASRVNNISKQL